VCGREVGRGGEEEGWIGDERGRIRENSGVRERLFIKWKYWKEGEVEEGRKW
jgi:hypothetical protein